MFSANTHAHAQFHHRNECESKFECHLKSSESNNVVHRIFFHNIERNRQIERKGGGKVGEKQRDRQICYASVTDMGFGVLLV